MEKAHRSNFYAGLSGIELPVPKYQFPPEFQKTSRLTYYATFFNSIEINSSFYKIPMRGTVGRWASSVPANFRFTFKLSREITHIKDLAFDVSYIKQFLDIISYVGEKKGCLLVQFPPSLQNESIGQLARLLTAIQEADPDRMWPVALEFRSRTWYTPEVYDLLQYYRATLVIHDIQHSATPLNTVLSDLIYVRFHGPTGNYRGSYAQSFLQEYTEYIEGWLREGKKVYVYFNNTAGDAFNNLKTLTGLMDRPGFCNHAGSGSTFALPGEARQTDNTTPDIRANIQIPPDQTRSRVDNVP